MSNWTHVAAVVRIDGIDLKKSAIEKHFGKTCFFESPGEVWDDLERCPDRYLPAGSEGTLEVSVWMNPDKNCVAAATVSIFGDLRDHDNPQEIVDWFKKKMEGLLIRQAAITVENEFNGVVNWIYSED